MENNSIDTITKFVMVLLVTLGIVLDLMETVMVPDWSTSIGGLLKPLNPNGICPKTFLTVLMVKT